MQCALSKFKESLLLATHNFTFFNFFSVFALGAWFNFSWHIGTASSAYKPFLNQYKLESHSHTQTGPSRGRAGGYNDPGAHGL